MSALDTEKPRSLWRLVAGRALANQGLKIGLTIAGVVIFLPIYLGLQHVHAPEHYRTLPLWFVDRAIPFAPDWIWIYISQYIIIPLVPLVSWTREQVWRFVTALAIVSVIAFLIFLFFPVACPRPSAAEIELAQPNFMFRWIIAIDGTVNAFPSLHMGLAGVAAFFAPRVIDEAYGRKLRIGLIAFIWAWTLLILYSIVATRQHYFVDGLAGLALAYGGHRIAWWRVDRTKGNEFAP
ncbi:MAG: phosphatase PAP2 family protein [Phycisphaeraceae bacterium]